MTSVANDLKLVGLPPEASVDDLKRRWKSLALVHHPDRGGDPELFQRLSEAVDRLTVALAKPIKCPACKGTGSVYVRRGSAAVRTRCSACGGKGVVRRGQAQVAVAAVPEVALAEMGTIARLERENRSLRVAIAALVYHFGDANHEVELPRTEFAAVEADPEVILEETTEDFSQTMVVRVKKREAS